MPLDIQKIQKGTTSWVHPGLDLRKSPIEGFGLFAKEKIKKGTKVSVFGGKVYTSDEIDKMPKNSYVANVASQLDNDFFLGPLKKPKSAEDYEWGFFVNHSCNPNTKIWRSVFLVAIKNIKPGDEITFNYAHSHNKGLGFTCKCGSKNCRKFVSNSDYLNKAFYTKNRSNIVGWMKDLVETA